MGTSRLDKSPPASDEELLRIRAQSIRKATMTHFPDGFLWGAATAAVASSFSPGPWCSPSVPW
ncbi:hypothetical protein SAMN04489712_1356 [Thermomonospora echinospora]|uniref:Uncharacterized protein n=1 Tax=Thermomonospora echinospora TaxID=1992 RepID=A0A1H6E6Z7_9ACTN|nr:hypothetical protein SAMN04489712_1356 [Thermomonospora echinospora]